MFITSTNPNAGLRPLFFDSRTTKYWNSAEFAEFGIQIADEFFQHGVQVSGIIGDNLRAQLAGLAHWKDNSFQNLDNERITNIHRAIISVPCCCHTLNLAEVISKTIDPQLKGIHSIFFTTIKNSILILRLGGQ